MGVQIQFRRGTAAEWTAAATVLLAGELGYETDTGKFKIGDGTTAWTSLAYASMTDTSAVPKSLYDAQTILQATSDNTPAALTIGEQTVVGRITGGNIVALTIAQLQTLLFSAGLPENVEITLATALTVDGKYSGLVIPGTAGATLAFGEVCYLAAADSRWELAKADAEATSGPVKLGMCVLAAANDGSTTKMLLKGNIRADAKFPTLTISGPVYISAATAGLITSTIPVAANNVERIIGHGNTGDELYFNPENDWQVHV